MAHACENCISLKFIPGMPAEFFAGFYPGLGTALAIAGIRYFVSWIEAVRKQNATENGLTVN